MSSRNEARERQWLAEVSGGDARFVELVLARLAVGDERFGDSFLWAGTRILLTELAEEGLDLAGWGALCDEQLACDRRLTELHRRQIASVLRVAARHGAEAHRLLAQALASIDRIGHDISTPKK